MTIGNGGRVDVMVRTRPSDVGRRIRIERKGRRWTQKELAQRVGVDTSYVSKVESGGIQAPSGEILEKFASTLGWSTTDLLRGRAPSSPDEAWMAHLRDSFGPEKAHVAAAAIEAIRELPPNDRDQAIEVFWALATNWPKRS